MIKITFTGDILISPEQLTAVYKSQGKYDFDYIFEHIKKRFKESDCLIGNLETPLAGEDLEYTHHKWSFNTPDSLALALKNAGFTILSTANNHCLDRGKEGLRRTIEVLDKYDLKHTGTYKTTEDPRILVHKVKGIQIAILSYTYGTNAAFNGNYISEPIVNLFQPQERIPSRHLYPRVLNKLKRIMHFDAFNRRFLKGACSHRKYKRQIKTDLQEIMQHGVDITIMCMHAGGQYNEHPDIDTQNLMRFLLHNPIDVVIGNHPHVVHPFIKLGKKKGFYSLGDLCPFPGCASAELATPEVFPEYSILAHIYVDEQKKVAQKVSFEILKSVIDTDGIAKVHTLFDLINDERDELNRRTLLQTNLAIYNLVTNQQMQAIALQREYEL